MPLVRARDGTNPFFFPAHLFTEKNQNLSPIISLDALNGLTSDFFPLKSQLISFTVNMAAVLVDSASRLDLTIKKKAFCVLLCPFVLIKDS
jgi:hypothetical protein